jgi:hypothetical protein
MPTTITVERSRTDQREALANMAQLYIHDFTDFLRPKRIDLGDDGLYADEMRLEDYWMKADHSVWFIRAENKLAGFALLNAVRSASRPFSPVLLRAPIAGSMGGPRCRRFSIPPASGGSDHGRECAYSAVLAKAVTRARISNYEARPPSANPSRTLLRFVVGRAPATP